MWLSCDSSSEGETWAITLPIFSALTEECKRNRHIFHLPPLSSSLPPPSLHSPSCRHSRLTLLSTDWQRGASCSSTRIFFAHTSLSPSLSPPSPPTTLRTTTITSSSTQLWWLLPRNSNVCPTAVKASVWGERESERVWLRRAGRSWWGCWELWGRAVGAQRPPPTSSCSAHMVCARSQFSLGAWLKHCLTTTSTHTPLLPLSTLSVRACVGWWGVCVCVCLCVHICIVFSQVTDALAEKVVDSSELCGVKITRSRVTWGNAVVVVPYWSALASASLPPPASLEQTLSYTHVWRHQLTTAEWEGKSGCHGNDWECCSPAVSCCSRCLVSGGEEIAGCPQQRQGLPPTHCC